MDTQRKASKFYLPCWRSDTDEYEYIVIEIEQGDPQPHTLCGFLRGRVLWYRQLIGEFLCRLGKKFHDNAPSYVASDFYERDRKIINGEIDYDDCWEDE